MTKYLGTIIKITNEYIKEVKPEVIKFEANDRSRFKLYERFAKSIKGYDLYIEDITAAKIYQLIRK